jgi:limonene-1,2-epoxide hydrolase
VSGPQASAPRAPTDVVLGFFDAMTRRDLDAAIDLLTEDAVWINVSLPTVRGRRRIERILRGLDGRGRFRAHFHHVAAEGDVVLTERTDELAIGRFKQRFWVYGRLELRDGRIAVWRDSFDWLDITVSLVRALAGMVAPRLNRPWPGGE